MLLDGKKGLIIGVANKHSIAWAIAQSAVREGAQLLFNYQSDRLRENVEELARTIPKANAFPCDVGDDTQIDALMKHVEKDFGRLDFLVHSVAFAPREELTGHFSILRAPDSQLLWMSAPIPWSLYREPRFL
jgi:Enoyl-[acyl-carrier-protein] reductase (NADH)